MATKPTTDILSGFGRIPVTGISPVIEGGAYPAKAVVGELIPIRATIFREGHDAVNASVVLVNPKGREKLVPMQALEPKGLDPWEAWVRLDAPGLWRFRIEGWSDPWHTWLHNADAKLHAGIDTELVAAEFQALLDRVAPRVKNKRDLAFCEKFAAAFTAEAGPEALLKLAFDPKLAALMEKYGPRDLVSPTAEYPIFVDRERALCGSWYELFPRSVGAKQVKGKWISGTFDDCHTRLEEIAAMGFDVVYLPPIHPIGRSYRKGRNNTLDPTANDPGSPWAIGNADGGHDAINPELGDFAAFDRFVAKAESVGLEVALDLALQCSPDHPWVTAHPEWFSKRIDGSIAYAENPPKKYQDIYPLNFDNDPEGIYAEIWRIIELWISHGVKIFRVDNPHTKPLPFWARLHAELREKHPEVITLAEAFTKPAMMHSLGKLGFSQSYTYFTWRTAKWELEQYLGELSHLMDSFYRPNFFVNTPDINPFFLQSGNPAAFAIRAVLAATMSPSWGVYSGFELYEHEPLAPGREEYLNSEKYEFRPRDFTAEPNLSLLIGSLNDIRHKHPALQQLRQFNFHGVENERIIAYSKRDGDDVMLMVVSLNPDATEEGWVHLNMPDLGLDWGARFAVEDRLTGSYFHWDQDNFVRLPPENPAHILRVWR
ncbi:MAG: alpha-1,4-glucan--maltose-1-phosphate maltosyltransferase [Propionibacteriaceae bacterium]|nr:alpha-1,4-glucan--maltose-1-phosphate maltosyltransferase [Propionibacteriaceae bacterium]